MVVSWMPRRAWDDVAHLRPLGDVKRVVGSMGDGRVLAHVLYKLKVFEGLNICPKHFLLDSGLDLNVGFYARVVLLVYNYVSIVINY